MYVGTRSAALTAWGGAWLAGEATDDAVAESVCLPGEEHVALTTGGRLAPFGWLLGELRSVGVHGLVLALPVPGDVSGLVGPGELTTAAIDAGEAVLGWTDHGSVGIVPRVEVHDSPFDGTTTSVAWRWIDAGPLPLPLRPTMADADQALRQALLDVTAELARLDVAAWRPELAGALADLRRDVRAGRAEPLSLPGRYSAKAAQLLATAASLGRVVDLAAGDHGASVTSAEMRGRAEALARLAAAVRQARCAAINSVHEPVEARG